MLTWIFGIFAFLAGLLGAVLASRAVDLGMATFGMGLVVFAAIFIFWLMKDYWDEEERAGTR